MPRRAITDNTLFYGDNLIILRDYIADESIDLIYLDPPFNSNRGYNVLFHDESGIESESQIVAFEDTWHWNHVAEQTYHALVTEQSDEISTMISAMRQFIGTNQMMAYLVMMAARLVELHRVLKPTGSLYLHCDPTASHYLKIILDTIFGPANFRNEIIWQRTNVHNDPNRWGRIHDIILFYSKSGTYTWNHVFQPYTEKYLGDKYRNSDARGTYRLSDLTGAGATGGDSSKPWRGYNPAALGRHWAVSQDAVNSLVSPETAAKMNTQEKLDLLYGNDYIYLGKQGVGFPQFKRYLGQGVPIQDTMTDIPPINSQATERLGYPTQKPLALLERIIAASSNPGEIVLDPFCGCGTAIAAAQTLKRKWVGIDITQLSIALQKYRLEAMFPGIEFRVIGEPKDIHDAAKLALDDRYQFQWWALSLIRARPQGGESGSKTGKKGSDRGIDGTISFIDDRSHKPKRVIVQVKSGHVKSGDIRDLKGTLDRENATIGVFITLEPASSEMTREAVSAGFYHSDEWNKDYSRIQILTIADLLNGTDVKMPPQSGTFREAAAQEDAAKAKQPSLLP